MKNLKHIILCTFLFVLLIGCKKEYKNVNFDKKFRMRPDQTIILEDGAIFSIREFSESRCRKGKFCITKGGVSVSFSLGEESELVLLENNVIVGDYTISFLEASPDQGDHEDWIPHEDYVFKFKISKN